jgi:anti-sigma regulatory factor (Ser/Thr protein kinase)
MVAGLAHSLVLELSESAPAAAREHVGLVCAGVVSLAHAEEVTLVVTELVSNAVQHGKGQITLALRASRGEVFVAVQDTGPAFLVPPVGTDPFREGGRGLAMVAQLASNWGILSLGEAGNLVWCAVHARARCPGRANPAGPGVAFLLGSSDRMDEPATRGPITVVIDGEPDARHLRRDVLDALTGEPRDLVIDMRQVLHLSNTEVAVLVGVQARLHSRLKSLTLVCGEGSGTQIALARSGLQGDFRTVAEVPPSW